MMEWHLTHLTLVLPGTIMKKVIFSFVQIYVLARGGIMAVTTPTSMVTTMPMDQARL